MQYRARVIRKNRATETRPPAKGDPIEEIGTQVTANKRPPPTPGVEGVETVAGQVTTGAAPEKEMVGPAAKPFKGSAGYLHDWAKKITGVK
jgi:hypothetical protein